MIRRIVGIAGVAELRGLSDEVVRAACEARALAFGQVLLKQVRRGERAWGLREKGRLALLHIGEILILSVRY